MNSYNIYLIAEKTEHPPLELGYLKAFLLKNLKKGINVIIKSVEDFESTIDKKFYDKGQPNLIGFSCYNDPQIFINLSKKIKKKIKRVNIVLVGPAINTSFYDKINFYPVDFIVYGEGEETFFELVYSIIRKDLMFEKIKGLIYRNGKKYKINPPRPPIKDLNKIPSPYLNKIFDVKNYSEFYIEGSRGCLYNCGYCAVTNRIIKYRGFDFKRLKLEVAFILSQNPKVKSIEFCDSDIFLDIQKAKKIFEYIKTIKRNVFFNFNSEINKFNPDILKYILDPRITFGFGVQTLTKKALKQANRIFDIKELKDHFLKYSPKMLEYSYPFTLSFIYGLPGDNLKNFKKTIDYALSSGAKLDFFRLMIWKNTFFEINSKKLSIKYSKKYPYKVLSTKTYTANEIKKTEEILSEIKPIAKLCEMDRFFHTLLLKCSSIIKHQNPYLTTYKKFSTYLKNVNFDKNKIESILTKNKFGYLINPENYALRLTLYSEVLKFISNEIKKSTSIKDRYILFDISNFLTISKKRLFIQYNFNSLVEISSEFIDIKNSFHIKWLDFFGKDFKNGINITDKYCDKSRMDFSIPIFSITDFIPKNFFKKVTVIWNVFSWFGDDIKKELLSKVNSINIIDSLNNEDFALIKKRFKKINSFNLIGEINLYICYD
ncbi:MAG: radical SAM protein [Elusimicrobiota bacterium]